MLAASAILGAERATWMGNVCARIVSAFYPLRGMHSGQDLQGLRDHLCCSHCIIIALHNSYCGRLLNCTICNREKFVFLFRDDFMNRTFTERGLALAPKAKHLDDSHFHLSKRKLSTFPTILQSC